MKNRCEDYSYFSLNALSYLTTLLIGIAFGLSISIMTFHISENIYKSTVNLIYLIVSLVVLGIVFRGITIYFWYKSKEWAAAKKLACPVCKALPPPSPRAGALSRFCNKLGALNLHHESAQIVQTGSILGLTRVLIVPLRPAIVWKPSPRSLGEHKFGF